jgi:flavin-dependent dehydrogenase
VSTNGTGPNVEEADVVIVGARLAGCATGIPLAKAGRKVVAIDRAKFPSNTISTHGLFPGHAKELEKLGALQRVLDLDPPKVRKFDVYHLGWHVVEHATDVEGIDYGFCIARTDLDLALVETAREQGVDVRERTAMTEVIFEDGRARGIRYKARDGSTGEIRAPLTVGADGRRSPTAAQVGADPPYRGSKNGRGFAYWYLDDPKMGTHWRETLTLWQIGLTHVMTAPMPHGRMVAILMAPTDQIAEIRRDPDEMLARTLREHRHLADRIQGGTNWSKPFIAEDMPAFFRRSSGPGWALTGDAGHYKDAVIGQGIRDALEWGRRLGETAAPLLYAPDRLDTELRKLEHARDRAVLPTYHWANSMTRVAPVLPVVTEAFRDFSRAGRPELSDIFARTRTPQQVFSPWRGVKWVTRALARPGVDRPAILRYFWQEASITMDHNLERLLNRFRPTRRTASENPGWVWPPARARVEEKAEEETQELAAV